MQKPTPRQLDVLIFMWGFREVNGYLPSQKEVGDALCMAQATVSRHFHEMVSRGLIKHASHAWHYGLIYIPGLPRTSDGDPLYSPNAMPNSSQVIS